ncbi:MAG: hypothetical protein ACI4PU_06095 [Intestinibacter sp.]
MAITNFQQTIWSKKIQHQLQTITSLKDHCDFQFEGDIKQAKEVKILGVNRPTIRTYIPGTPLTREAGTDSSQLLKIDQFRYFDFEVEDIDKAQSVPGLIEALSKEATLGLSEEADKYVASLTVTAAAGSEVKKAAATDISGVTDGGISLIETGFKVLYENNCKVSDSFYLEITPEWYTILRPEIITLDTNNSDLIKKGFVGKYGNALISVENLLGTATVDSKECKLAMLRTSKAIAFAGQIDKVEAYRPHDAFQDAIKGLYVFGAKIVRPEQLYLFPIY